MAYCHRLQRQQKIEFSINHGRTWWIPYNGSPSTGAFYDLMDFGGEILGTTNKICSHLKMEDRGVSANEHSTVDDRFITNSMNEVMLDVDKIYSIERNIIQAGMKDIEAVIDNIDRETYIRILGR